MAKKKKSAKKTSAMSQRSVPLFSLPVMLRRDAKAAAGAIVQEIIYHMTQTVQSRGKTFTAGALDEWRLGLTKSVFRRLLEGGNWNNDRSNVLTVAGDMAVIACMLSGSQAQVSKVRVNAAFRAVKDHATCPVNLGSGVWCDF